MLNDFRSSACPLCGSGAIAAAGAIAYETPVRFSSREIQLERTPELWRCRQCRSGFAQNILPEQAARALYSEADSTARWVPKSMEAQEMPETLAELARLCQPGARVLDVGANAGDLLDFARARGCETDGVEYSAAGQAALRRKGHGVHASLDAAPAGYALITAFDTVEHLYDLPRFFEACRARLAPGGRLLLLTGDIECASARVSGPRWWYVTYPEHIAFPSRRYLRGRPGLALERCARTYPSPGYNMPWRARLPVIISRLARGKYQGLPSLGPDHLLATLRASAS